MNLLLEVPKTTIWNGDKKIKNGINSLLGKEKIYIKLLVKQYVTIEDM